MRDGHLDLESLGTPGGFTARHVREGSMETYQLAFLMTDYLVRRHGFERVSGYFRILATGRGRYESFQLAFGQDLGEFEQEIVVHFGPVPR